MPSSASFALIMDTVKRTSSPCLPFFSLFPSIPLSLQLSVCHRLDPLRPQFSPHPMPIPLPCISEALSHSVFGSFPDACFGQWDVRHVTSKGKKNYLHVFTHYLWSLPQAWASLGYERHVKQSQVTPATKSWPPLILQEPANSPDV